MLPRIIRAMIAETTALTQRQKRMLQATIIAGVLLRVLVALLAPYDVQNLGGGDAKWYIVNGMGLYSGQPDGVFYELPFYLSQLPTAPLYLIFVGFWFTILPDMLAFVVVRGLQIAMNLLMIYMLTRIAKRLSQSDYVAWLLAMMLLLAPPLITEPSALLTETLYMLLIVSGLWAYLVAVHDGLSWRYLCVAAVLFALATLTRAVSLAFPLGLAGLLILSIPHKSWKQRLLPPLIFLAIYVVGIGTWTAYNVLVYERVILGSDQLEGAVWRGASPDDASPQQNDELLGDATAGEQTATIITSDPVGYLTRRISELGRTYLQPHGTIEFGDEGLRSMASAWVRDGFSPSGFWHLITGEGFWIKSLFYLWHLTALIFGFIGMWMMRKKWQLSFALMGFIAYTTLLHLFTLDLPRYLFPMYPIYWVFAAIALVRLWGMMIQREGSSNPSHE